MHIVSRRIQARITERPSHVASYSNDLDLPLPEHRDSLSGRRPTAPPKMPAPARLLSDDPYTVPGKHTLLDQVERSLR